MTGEAIGTARIDVEVHTDPLVAGMKRAEGAIGQFTKEAQSQFQQMTAAEKRMVQGITRQATQMAMTKDEWLKYNATLKLSGPIQKEVLDLIERNTRSIKKQGIEFNDFGRSQKQVVAAMRQVPAQLTDIFVSLQGGQNPLTVLIQQGGQLKDVFGGIRPAAAALGAQLLKLINPYTLIAAAIGTVGVAWFQAEKEQENFAKSLILTGGYAGVTQRHLDELAASLAHITGSQGDAAAALSKVAATGKFTGEQLQLVAEAALEMEHATGQSIDDTVAQFARLADDPVKAVVELNKSMHFLTEATYQQVKALVEQGRQEEATTMVMRAASEAMTQRAGEVVQNVNTMAGAWLKLKGLVKETWSEMVHAELITSELGGAQRNMLIANQQLLQIADRLNKAAIEGTASKAMVDAARKRMAELQKIKADAFRIIGSDPGTKAAEQRAALARANEFAIAVDQEADLHVSVEKRREKLLIQRRKEADINIAAAMKAGNTQLAQSIRDNMAELERNIAEENKKKPRSRAGEARALENAQAKMALQDFKNTLAEEQAAIKGSTQVLEAEYRAKLISAKDYYAGLRDLAERGIAAEEAAIVGQIEVLQQRNVKGKDQVNVLREISALESQLARIREEGSAKLQTLTLQEQEYFAQRAESMLRYKEGLTEANLALRLQTEAMVARVGLGDEEFAQQQRIKEIYDEQAQSLRELQVELRNTKDQERYNQAVQDLQAFTDERVRIVQEGYDAMAEAESNWLNGLRGGLQDWIADTSKVATQIRDITKRSLDAATDALVDFATTGKLEIKSLLASILKDLVRFFMQRAVMQFAQMFLGSFNLLGTPQAATTGGASGFLSAFGSEYAKGDSFAGGTSLPSNTVLTKPTVFKFANGAAFNTGIAGEADPEAIMPLERGSDGKLGVRMYGGGNGPVAVNVNMVVNNNGEVEVNSTSEGERATQYQALADRMRDITKDEVLAQMRPGGMLYRMGHGVPA